METQFPKIERIGRAWNQVKHEQRDIHFYRYYAIDRGMEIARYIKSSRGE
jgi:hypothetical protein